MNHIENCTWCKALVKTNGKVCCRWCCKETHDHIECTDSSRCHCDCHDIKGSASLGRAFFEWQENFIHNKCDAPQEHDIVEWFTKNINPNQP